MRRTMQGQGVGVKWSQGRYDKALTSDSLRSRYGVPPLAEQEKQFRQYEEAFKGKSL
jgi:hypothetical protein